MESNSKSLNWVSQQIHPELRILIFLFHTVTDMDCGQKWITHDSQCKCIQSKDSEEDLSTVLSKLTMQSSFTSWMWPGCTTVFHARMALKSSWSPFKERESAFSPKTLPQLISLPSPSVPLPKTLLIMQKDHMTVFWNKSIHLQPSSPTSTHNPLTLLDLFQLHLLHTPPFSVSSLRCHSLFFAFSCPIELHNYTSFQKEKSTNKHTNGLQMIQLLYCRKKTYFGWKMFVYLSYLQDHYCHKIKENLTLGGASCTTSLHG